MNKTNCDVVNDLLPLYIDDICSGESKKIVEYHLNECEDCNHLYHMMKTEVKVIKDTDNSLIKKVKRKILIEKIVVSLLVMVLMLLIIIFSSGPLFVEKVNMNQVVSMEQVSIEEDEHGNLWLVRSGNAAAASMIIPEIYQTDAETPLMLKVVFLENRMDRWLQKIMNQDVCPIKEEKSIICSKENKTKYEKIVFEQETGKEKVLWERK